MNNAFQFPIPDLDFSVLLPLIVVVLTGIIALIVEIMAPKRNNNTIVIVSLAGLVLAAISIGFGFSLPGVSTANDMVVRDPFSSGLSLVLVVVSAVTIAFSEGYLRDKRIAHGEFYPLLLWSTAGALMMVSTQNLLVMFLGLEVLSVSLYVLAGLSRAEEKSEESALKYFLLGAFASGFFLYGVAFLYGSTGSLDLNDVSTALYRRHDSSSSLLLIGFGLILIGLAFKASLVPFHLWTPDVYQGAPTNVTAFMASASKVAAIGALYRLVEAYSSVPQFWLPILTTIAILTMCYGNFVALRQKDVKRMLGYSSIANAGYILVAIIAHGIQPSAISGSTVIFYLLSYCLMTIGSFAIVTLGTKDGREGTRFEDLHGLAKREPLATFTLVFLTASLIGFPGTSGFFGKLLIIRDGWNSDLRLLVFVLAINSVVSVYYYLGMLRAAYVTGDENAERNLSPLNPGVAAACIVCAVGVVGAGLFAGPVLSAIGSR